MEKSAMRMAIAAALCWLVGGTAADAADCSLGGRYDGQSKMPHETFEISLNLYCADGKYAAQLFTSEGEFVVRTVVVTPGGVKFEFDSGASLGSAQMTRKGAVLEGTVAIADESGTIVLKRAWRTRWCPSAIDRVSI
jgi:hypothetical protein